MAKSAARMWKDVWSGRADARSADHQHHERHSHQDLDGAGIFRALYDKYLGDWEENLTNEDFWRRVIDIPDAHSGTRTRN